MAYVPSREACKRLGVHENTLRKWADDGKIEHIRTGSGQRRYDVDAYLRGHGSSAVVCYCRVSSAKQRDDLARQVGFMQERFPQAEVIQDCGSGLNFKRKGLRSILERAMRGDKLRVVVAHRDRLCRFGFDLVRFVIERHGGEVVVLDDTKASPDKELVDDLLSIVHVFSCRLNGRRNYKGKKKPADADPRTEAVIQELDRLCAIRVQSGGGTSEEARDESELERDQGADPVCTSGLVQRNSVPGKKPGD
jgi:putative resolvase